MDRKDTKETGLLLIKKGKKGIVHAVFSRLGLVLLLLVLQVAVVLGIIQWFGEFLPHFFGAMTIFSTLVLLYLLNSNIDPTAKITWLIFITQIPVFGALFFGYTQTEVGHRALKKRLNELVEETKESVPQSEEAIKSLSRNSKETLALANYLKRTGCFPVYQNTKVTYFSTGEDKFQELLVQLKKAEKFIFLEYFIIDEGIMWGKILEILVKKAKQGVEIRLLYDGTCEFTTLPHDYPQWLQYLGIQCRMFAPVTPFLSTHYNYRDHRKILVIDGHTAFTGGVNLADEYINEIERYGHWKDAAIMLKGEAVRSFTLMFLQMWSITEKFPEFNKYLESEIPVETTSKGYVIPYGTCPLNEDKVGEMVYMDILNRSQEYVHIMSPYLILDGELETALKFAAERGVEVKIILPGIPDKKIPYALAKTHYTKLLKAGVQIYEYSPGFIHSKVFISDDCKGVVGTINLDYRSLYHHFECAAYLYQTPCISEMEKDFQETLKECHQVTWDTIKHEKWHTKMTGAVLKIIAPLL